MIQRDDELVAQVTSERAQVIETRNKMREALMHLGIKIAHENEMKPEDITAVDVAKYAFQMLDDDGNMTLTYKELREGLPEFGIFLTKEEFQAVCRIIDPDQDKELHIDEWMHFMQATDDDLELDEWKNALDAVKLRDKVKKALLNPAMALYWETAPVNSAAPSMLDIVEQIFTELDEDANGSLDYSELKKGLDAHDVTISPDEFRKLVALVDHEHHGDLTSTMFHQFMETSDKELQQLEADNKKFAESQVKAPKPPTTFERSLPGEESNPFAEKDDDDDDDDDGEEQEEEEDDVENPALRARISTTHSIRDQVPDMQVLSDDDERRIDKQPGSSTQSLVFSEKSDASDA